MNFIIFFLYFFFHFFFFFTQWVDQWGGRMQSGDEDARARRTIYYRRCREQAGEMEMELEWVIQVWVERLLGIFWFPGAGTRRGGGGRCSRPGSSDRWWNGRVGKNASAV